MITNKVTNVLRLYVFSFVCNQSYKRTNIATNIGDRKQCFVEIISTQELNNEARRNRHFTGVRQNQLLRLHYLKAVCKK